MGGEGLCLLTWEVAANGDVEDGVKAFVSHTPPELTVSYVASLDLEKFPSIEPPLQGLILPVARAAVDFDSPGMERFNLKSDPTVGATDTKVICTSASVM